MSLLVCELSYGGFFYVDEDTVTRCPCVCLCVCDLANTQPSVTDIISNRSVTFIWHSNTVWHTFPHIPFLYTQHSHHRVHSECERLKCHKNEDNLT